MTTARHLRSVDAPLRFGIAVRVSQVNGRQGERFHSPETQEAAARRAVAAAGGVVDETVGINGVFTDLDVSGKTAPSDRPGMGAALELVRTGRLTGVAVYDVSRWSRDTVSGLRELQEIAACGGQVISAAETIDVGTPSGMFTTTIQLAAAQLRRDEASKAWRATHASRHERGLPHGKVPLGYVAAGGQVTVDPVLGPAVSRAFELYAAGVATQVSIAADLTRIRGVLTRQQMVSKLLRNPFVTGLLIYNGDSRGGRHTPLVPVEVFERVQARLADDRFASPRLRAPVSPLAGMVFCTCGRSLYRRGRGASRTMPDMLRCPGMADGCPGVGAPKVTEIELWVKAEVLRRAQEEVDDVPAALARRSRAAQAGAEVLRWQAEEKALLASIGRTGALVAREVLDEVAGAATLRELRGQLGAVQARLAQAQGQAQTAVPVEALASAAERIERDWDELTAAEARALICLFLGGVTLRPAAYRGESVADRLTPQEP